VEYKNRVSKDIVQHTLRTLIQNLLLVFTETDVISLEKEVVASEDSALLKCYSVPLEIPLDYCRFIRPDGKGFNIVPQNK
jgi:hypothetical protein